MKYNIIPFFRNLAERQKVIIEGQKQILKVQDENLWANIFRDSIRGYTALENLPLNIGRWAGNYSFFYLLFRILKDFQPKNILDLGLGESSKFISIYLQNYAPDAALIIGEHDPQWVAFFKKNFKLFERSKIVELTLSKKIIGEDEINIYSDFEKISEPWYDLIIIDAPFGSPKNSRQDILNYISLHDFKKDFAIILDDTHRVGEQQTLELLLEKLKTKREDIYHQTYSGVKSSTVISNQKFLLSL